MGFEQQGGVEAFGVDVLCGEEGFYVSVSFDAPWFVAAVPVDALGVMVFDKLWDDVCCVAFFKDHGVV